MDLSPLRLKVMFQPQVADPKPAHLDWLSAESDELILSPLFTAFEDEAATVEFLIPHEFEIDHVARGLSIPVHVIRSDIGGLHLRPWNLEAERSERWNLLIRHLHERLGKMARIHPRVSVSGYGIRLSLNEAQTGVMFDVSLGGMSILTDLKVAEGSELTFQIQTPESMVWARFIHGLSWRGIVRNIQTRGLGIEFAENHPFSESIRKLIDEISIRRAERLTHPRYNIFDFDIHGITNEGVSVRARDISLSGAYLLSKHAPPVDGEVTIEFAPGPRFEALLNSLTLSGRVARITPDGFGVEWDEFKDDLSEKLSAWVKELSAHFSSLPLTEAGPIRAALTIDYDSDFLMLRDYLYNLSAGGLFLPGTKELKTGDAVQFTLDLSKTSFNRKVSVPLSFIGRVVRTTEKGIGVHFVDPEEVRTRLEAIMREALHDLREKGELIEEPKAKSRARPVRKKKVTPKSGSTTPFRKIAPHQWMMAVGIIALGLALSARWIRSPGLEEASRLSRQVTQSVETKLWNRSASEPRRQVVQIQVGTESKEVSLSDVIDVSYSREAGTRIHLKDGRTFRGEAVTRFLSEPLKEKLRMLIQAAEEQPSTP